jgi:hypothetical protein
MKIKSDIKAGLVCRKAGGQYHNQTLVRDVKKNLRVKTNVKAGAGKKIAIHKD